MSGFRQKNLGRSGFVLLCGLLSWFASEASADILAVPADYASVQSAINAAFDGDEVVVSPGTYTEAIDLLGKAIVLRSTDPSDDAIVESTRLDGTGLNAPVVVCASGESSTTLIDGLTIQNGSHAGDGGGMHLDGASPIVRRCRFIGNASGANGGGVFCSGHGFDISACQFLNNTSVQHGGGCYVSGTAARFEQCQFDGNETLVDGGRGGGLCCDGLNSNIVQCTFDENRSLDDGAGLCAIAAEISDCSFHDNLATGGRGGGAHVSESILSDCTFDDNRATSLGYGGGLFAISSRVEGSLMIRNQARDGGGMAGNDSWVVDCDFRDNYAAQDGGGCRVYGSCVLEGCVFYLNDCGYTGAGLSARESSSVVVTNCDFIGNQHGSAMWCKDNNPEISNCTFVKNRGGGLYLKSAWASVNACTFIGHPLDGARSLNAYTCAPNISNCIFWGAGGGIGNTGSPSARYCNIQGGYPGQGNIAVNPLFVDMDGADNVLGTLDDDLRLLPESLCYDAGSNQYILNDASDLDRDGDFDEPTPVDRRGHPRVTDDDNDGTATIDMGAHELDGEEPPLCPADIVPSGTVDVSDLLSLLGSWGTCVDCAADINNDDTVDVSDLLLLLAAWGAC